MTKKDRRTWQEALNNCEKWISSKGGTSLEALINPVRDEITYRLSRNAAILIGCNKTDSQNIFDEVKSLYTKRSALLHTGKTGKVKREELNRLRFYVHPY